MKSRAVRGVTVMEVLVAMTIIVIIVSILLPVTRKAVDKSKHAVCISNLRQIYTAGCLYEADYGEFPPNSVSWPALSSYYPKALRCPVSRAMYAEYDYDINWSSLGHPGTSDRKIWDQCSELRGEMLPILFDNNHAWRNPDRPTILLRKNGSIHVVSHKKTPDKPCQLPYDNFNL